MTEQFCDENLFHLSEQQARELYAQGQEAVVWALLKLSALARQKADPKPDPATPSAMIAPYQKPAPKGRRKKPGRKKGHPGRPAPPRIDIREEHRLERCPDCDGPLAPTKNSRTRIIVRVEDSATSSKRGRRSPSIRFTPVTIRAAKNASSPKSPRPCPAPPSATAPWPCRAGCTTAWATP